MPSNNNDQSYLALYSASNEMQNMESNAVRAASRSAPSSRAKISKVELKKMNVFEKSRITMVNKPLTPPASPKIEQIVNNEQEKTRTFIAKLSKNNDRKLSKVGEEIVERISEAHEYMQEYRVIIANILEQEQRHLKFKGKCLLIEENWAKENYEIMRKYREGKEIVVDTSDQDTIDDTPFTTPNSSPGVSSPSGFRTATSPLPKIEPPQDDMENLAMNNDHEAHLQRLQNEFLIKLQLRGVGMNNPVKKEAVVVRIHEVKEEVEVQRPAALSAEEKEKKRLRRREKRKERKERKERKYRKRAMENTSPL